VAFFLFPYIPRYAFGHLLLERPADHSGAIRLVVTVIIESKAGLGLVDGDPS
jgi:hypothetical protein